MTFGGATKAGFKTLNASLRRNTQTIVHALSVTNTDLHHSDRADADSFAEYEHFHQTPTFTLTFARLLKFC